jgi:hemin uptake protein HemP
VGAFKYYRLVIVALALSAGGATARAQNAAAAAGNELAQARAELIESAEEAKASTRDLLSLKEAELVKAEGRHEQLKQLFAEGLVAKREVDASENLLSSSRAALEDLRKQIDASALLVAATRAAAEAERRAEKMAKLRPLLPASSRRLLKPTLGYGASAVMIRHNGAALWTTTSGLAGVQSFFQSTFGRALPVSALGQTATHGRLGFDHSRAVDVALHPDSAEGRALMAYLQSRGIAFIAFRGPVPGSATGAHIHIGPPSHRVG